MDASQYKDCVLVLLFVKYIIRQLADRYASPLPQIVDEVEQLAATVAAHLQKMRAY